MYPKHQHPENKNLKRKNLHGCVRGFGLIMNWWRIWEFGSNKRRTDALLPWFALASRDLGMRVDN